MNPSEIVTGLVVHPGKLTPNHWRVHHLHHPSCITPTGQNLARLPSADHTSPFPADNKGASLAVPPLANTQFIAPLLVDHLSKLILKGEGIRNSMEKGSMFLPRLCSPDRPANSPHCLVVLRALATPLEYAESAE